MAEAAGQTLDLSRDVSPHPVTSADSAHDHDPLATYRTGEGSPPPGGDARSAVQRPASVDVQQQDWEKAQADNAIKGISGATRAAASNGYDYVGIFPLGYSGNAEYSHQSPHLDENEQRIFDALKAQGLNPSVEPTSYKGEKTWMIVANWKDGENPDKDLQALTHREHDQTAAFLKRVEEERQQAEKAAADKAITDIAATTQKAAKDGDDSATIFPIKGHSYSSQPPSLNPDEQRVLDALKTRGLNPSIERGYNDRAEEMGWLIKANWKDGAQNLDLQKMTQDSKAAMAAWHAMIDAGNRERENAAADLAISHIPAKVRDAQAHGETSAQILPLGLAEDESFGPNDPENKPPLLDAAQQKVFDALKGQGLNPSFEKRLYADPPDRELEWTWLLTANWTDGKQGN